MDVSKAFGWNLKERDNVWVRRRTTCNVLPLEGHMQQIDLSSLESASMRFTPLEHEQGVGFLFGNYTDLPPESHPEYIFKASLFSANRSLTYGST